MAKLIFFDKTEKIVGHNQAAAIHLIMTNQKEPENPTQAAYALQVKEIKFDPLPGKTATKVAVDSSERKLKIQEIMQDRTLKGREKARKVAKALKGEL